MNLHESGEMYLETILILSKKNPSDGIRSVDVGSYMGYSKPSVSRAVGLLKKQEYITVDKDGYIKLTEAGRNVAEKIYDRHTTLTELLVCLGVERQTAAIDACKMEHAIGDESFAAIKAHVQRHRSDCRGKNETKL